MIYSQLTVLEAGQMVVHMRQSNFNEILDLANTPIMKDTAAIVQVTLPTKVYNGLNHMPLDVPILRSGAVIVEPNMLDIFSKSITQIKHVY